MSLHQFWERLRRDLKRGMTTSHGNRSRASRFSNSGRATALVSRQSQRLEQRLMLTSDLTEVLNYTSLELSAEGTLEIEIGGTTPGNPADGNDVDGFDQINVTGSGTVVLNGFLDVRLVNNYVPAVGTTFDFLNISSTASIVGKFSNGLGLYAFPDNDRYFDVVTTGDGGLRLEVKALPGGLQFAPPDSQRDAFGRFLSSYFDKSVTTFSFAGSIAVGGFATFSGMLAFEKGEGENRVVGSAVNVRLDQETAGVEIQDASFG
ncbi:MAG: hypothetical protein ACKOEO_22880, partial [Planctomycetaceae bacterium]